MPTYEYECEDCGYKFEKFQKMSDKPIKKCPKCAGGTKRLIGKGIGVIFKGQGFYATDYKKGVSSGRTCCGRDEPCDKPPCSDDGVCKR
ncbi:MAG: zinc ribbon domain-containing protein [Candidatus Omnitrophica bacterium]|nr:zinc ribbon domain-containing protein [Candidatus Omnitrophota bacterium]